MSSYLVSEATSSFGTFVETQFIWNFRGYQWSSVGSSVWRCGNTLEVDRKQHQRNHREEEEKKEQLTELTTKLSSEIVTFGNEEQSKVIGAGSICRKRNWETVSSSQVAVDTRSNGPVISSSTLRTNRVCEFVTKESKRLAVKGSKYCLARIRRGSHHRYEGQVGLLHLECNGITVILKSLSLVYKTIVSVFRRLVAKNLTRMDDGSRIMKQIAH
ncbi:unnamed protein product [Caenorhabditis nigoni]